MLVIDDDSRISPAIDIWLRRHGLRVFLADGGIDGLAALAPAPFEPMPVAVFHSIGTFHRSAPNVPSIAISAFPGPDTPAADFFRVAGCTPGAIVNPLSKSAEASMGDARRD
jgi:hypothetical protein